MKLWYSLVLIVTIQLTAGDDKTTQQFAAWLRALGPEKPASTHSAGRSTLREKLSISRRSIFTVQGISGKEERKRQQPAQSPSRKKTGAMQLSAQPQLVALGLAPAAPLATTVTLFNEATSSAAARLQEEDDIPLAATASIIATTGPKLVMPTEHEFKQYEQQHIPISLPEYFLAARVAKTQTGAIVPQKKPAAVTYGATPFYAGTIDQTFEDKVINKGLQPTIHIMFDPTHTQESPQGTLHINTYLGKESSVTNITDFNHLNVIIPDNYLPVIQSMVHSPTQTHLIIWNDPSQLPTHDIKERLQQDMVGLYVVSSERVQAITHQPTPPAAHQATLQAPKKVAKRWPGNGFQRIINAYKAQLELVNLLQKDGTKAQVLDTAEKTIITIAHMLTEHSSMESMQMLQRSGVNITELGTWTSVPN